MSVQGVNVLSPKAYVEKASEAIQKPILPSLKPDVVKITPEAKKGIHKSIKKLDDANLLQKTRRYINNGINKLADSSALKKTIKQGSKTKTGKWLIAGAMALTTLLLGKATAETFFKY